jgi:hypothetical protein
MIIPSAAPSFFLLESCFHSRRTVHGQSEDQAARFPWDGLSALGLVAIRTLGVAQGWYEVGPLARRAGCSLY